MNTTFVDLLSLVVVTLYGACLFSLMLYGAHRWWTVFLYWKYRGKKSSHPVSPVPLSSFPLVAIQLPLYNERYVADRLIEAVSAMDYPQDKLEIQVLDDSTDETVKIVQAKAEQLRRQGFQIQHVRRPHRHGYKAGALGYGMERSNAEFFAVFDADFVPPPDFLKATLPSFSDPVIGMVQTRWGHLNTNDSLLTRVQAILLDGHFVLEHTARNKSGAFFNFNGTAGIWRREAIESAGGWSPRTLTEDMDLSFRSQLAGWKFEYLPDIVCPAELPVDISSFHSQQRRWTKGAIQVARHLLKDLWTAKVPFHVKMEGTIHLTANMGYLLTVMLSFLLLPSLLLRHNLDFPMLKWLEIFAFFVTTLSVGVFYAVSQRELYSDWKWRMRDLFSLMSIGIGMCVNNTLAVCEGLWGRNSEFIRTPKWGGRGQVSTFHFSSRKVESGDLTPSPRRQLRMWIVSGLFALYSLISLGVASYIKDWLALPFICLFVFGFTYSAGLSFMGRFLRE